MSCTGINEFPIHAKLMYGEEELLMALKEDLIPFLPSKLESLGHGKKSFIQCFKISILWYLKDSLNSQICSK